MILPEYLDTLFLVRRPPAEGWPRRFAVITAANAFSAGSRAGDSAADIALRRELSRMKTRRIRVTGVAPDWNHREQGWAAWPLSLEQSLDLGRRYHQNAIFWIEDGDLGVVSCQTGERRTAGVWTERLRTAAERPAAHVYVVELDPAVLDVKRFRAANPGHRPGMRCLYVGKTGLTPEVRFQQHKDGYKSCPLVRKFGLRLAPELFPTPARVSKAVATALEASHAEDLRRQGHAVWQK